MNPITLDTIVTGGQTGADQGAWEAAADLGLEPDGWMPHGFKTEAGPMPGFAVLYNAREHASEDYAVRTAANAAIADAVVVFAEKTASSGTLAARREARAQGIPFALNPRPDQLEALLRDHAVGRLMVGGNRESKVPGIQARVRAYLVSALRPLLQDR